MATAIPFTLDLPTILSLTAVLSLLPLSLILAILLVPSNHLKYRALFFWHAYDALTHFFVEGSFLYHCFFTYTTPTYAVARAKPYFLNRGDRLYGAAYGTGPTARLWQEYGKADARWLGADLGRDFARATSGAATATATAQKKAAMYKGRLWFVAIGLAVAELYGGFMTFAPEWLSGNMALETGDPVYFWLYLVFFNMLWVFVPIWVLWVGWTEVRVAFVAAADGVTGKKRQ
ncbi:conserved hypothetical protein [Uncinocarpus reesii 1704]|uniref:EXPERA domain-containing protein n=1 Tax=Uncinocarpus reesii (strain UAMH 1704) TaxID=336963 RepID=C4JXG6_UNCRE|nr:uncharacterized protein UREG_06339 [Uncinocarpus reesii 1704]EEP81474.1 conserved hypothetical protein [Uncinocarpus reesii 1704]